MVRRPDEQDEGYVPDEDDPDYELSEAAGHRSWEPPRRGWLRPIIVIVSLIMLIAMVAPLLLDMLRLI